MASPGQRASEATGELKLPNGWHELWLSSTSEVASLREAVAAAMATQGYGQRDLFGMKLAVEEALVNAVRHGHLNDSGKRVHVRYQVSPEHVLVEVEDQEPGFAPFAVSDTTAPENLERPYGRGLLLMRMFTSWLRYNQKGDQVTLCKYPSLPASRQPSLSRVS